MAEQQIFYYPVTLTGAATARSILDLVTDSALDFPLAKNISGQCVSLNFVADKAIKVGYAANQLDDTHGGSLASGVYFQDSATGVSGNTIPIGQIFLYSPTSSGTASVTIYLRFIG